MPIPSRNENEDKNQFISRCISSDVMKEEYPDMKQRTAVCMSRACEDMDMISQADFQKYFEDYGYEEEVTEDNFYFPADAEYIDFGEEELEWDVAKDKPGLWENIRKKKEREGKNYKPAKKGDPDRPDPEAWKKAQSGEGGEGGMSRSQLKKIATQAMELYNMMTEDMEIEAWVQDNISKAEAHVASAYDYMKYTDVRETEKEESYAVEYQGRKVKLNKPFRTPDGPKKMSVYVKNDKGNVVKVNFGDPNMEIKKDNPKRRKSFRARHNCNNPGPRWKARFWSCKAW